MSDTNLEKAVADELAADFKPTPFPRPPLTAPPRTAPLEPANRASRTVQSATASHEQWLQLGEKLHDQAQERVTGLQRAYDDLHADLVVKARELQTIKADLTEAQRHLALFRQRLGYGG